MSSEPTREALRKTRAETVEFLHSLLKGLQTVSGSPGLSLDEQRHVMKVALDLSSFISDLGRPGLLEMSTMLRGDTP